MSYPTSTANAKGVAHASATRSHKVLVFDDEPGIGALAVAKLIELNCEAKSVTAKSDFLAVLDAWCPDFILLDLSLGETDAIDLFQLLRNKRFAGQVILMSGHSGAVLDHARRIGEASGISIAGVLEKPFRTQTLRSLIAKLHSVAAPQVAALLAHQPNSTLLHEALANNWVEFWYQPKVELDSGRVVGAESLVRIRHPENGIVSPIAFLPLASDEDLNALTLRALDSALRCSTELQQCGRSIVFSINVAGRTIVRSGLIDDIKSIREQYSSNTPIILELTESDFIDDKVAAAAFATRAILHGFQISIDDFGHGYATFDRLREIPFNELKLERTMVDGCARDPALRNICKAALQLARGFGAQTVAEGVERRDDLNVIRSLGFDMVQGFIFSKPLPFQDFLTLPAEFWIQPHSVTNAATRR